MKRHAWIVVAALAACEADERPPPAPVASGSGPGTSTVGEAATTGIMGTSEGGGSGGSGSGGGANDSETGVDPSASATDSGAPMDTSTTADTGEPLGPCTVWANKWVECVDPAADPEPLALNCDALFSNALIEYGPDCATAIGDVLACIVEIDCKAFVAYDGGHGVIPQECAAEQSAQDEMCI